MEAVFSIEGIGSYCNVETTTYETDIEKAKELLEGAGWIDTDGDGVREKDGVNLEIVLSYTNDLTAVEYAVLAVKSQLEAVGFSVKKITDILFRNALQFRLNDSIM